MLLNENYHAFFGLEYNPFIKNNCDRFIFDSSDLKEVNYKLDYLFRTKGIGIITGNPGSGKTTSLRNYVKKLNTVLIFLRCLLLMKMIKNSKSKNLTKLKIQR